VGYELVEWPDASVPEEAVDVVVRAARRASLCFGQQMLDRDDRKIQRTRRWVLGQLLEQAGTRTEEPGDA
jgi:hypothetical protein